MVWKKMIKVLRQFKVSPRSDNVVNVLYAFYMA